MKQVNRKKNTRPKKTFKSELKRRFDMWLLQHAQAFIFSLGQYIKHPVSNILTTAVIGISLALACQFLPIARQCPLRLIELGRVRTDHIVSTD